MDALTFDKVFSSFSVNDLEKAYEFYKKVLNLHIAREAMGTLSLRAEGSKEVIMIYPKPNHEPATFTVLNLGVADVEAAADALIGKGIKFEQYNNADIKTDEKGISRGKGPVIAWFKDPAGNIISIVGDK